MRNRLIGLASALVVMYSATASAQATLPTPSTPRDQAASGFTGQLFGNVDFGAQLSTVKGDPARYQRYRDLRDAPLAKNVLFARRTADWTFSLGADNIGLRDQRYSAQYRKVGKLQVNFVWDQIPLFISGDTRTLYRESEPGVFRLDDAMQANNQAGTTTIRDYTSLAAGFDARTRRDIGLLDIVYRATPATDLKINVRSASRNGSMPYGAPFGFSNLVELAVPIDQRTTDTTTLLEWANQRGLVSVGWDGSWFNNSVPALIWDNPLKITDSPSYSSAYSDGKGPAQARMALWPNNTQQYVHATGSLSTAGRGRLTAYVAVGEARQDAELLPHTINSQIPVIPLERPTAEARVRNTMFHVQYTARPVRQFALNARYRYADVDNRTPHFETLGRVRFDGVYDDAANSPEPEPYSVKRKTFDVDGTFSVLPYSAVRVGYTNAISDRTFRVFEETVENAFRLSFDTTGNQYVSFRALFEDTRREGDHFEEHLLEAVGEQPGMRHYDVADRDRKRFTLMATATPVNFLGFSASAGIGRDEYPQSEFGLQAYDSDQYALGVDVIPNDRIGFNVTYAWENYASLTESRNASPGVQFTDPRRNWFTDYDGKVKNVDATLDIEEIAGRTDLRLGVNWSDANDVYTYLLVAGSTLPAPSQLDPIVNEILRGSIELSYRLTPKVRLGGVYWYENFNTEDFALGPATISDIALPIVQPGAPVVPTSTLLLGYLYRPYTAHTGMVRLTYLW